jgi:hypothetical protein
MAKQTSDPEVERKISEINRLDNEIRGSYLVATSYLEHNIDNAIASHFYPNPRSGDPKRVDLLWFILTNHSLGFRTKVAIYTALIKKRYPQLWKKYSSEITELEGVAKFRNMLAHAGSALPDEDLSKVDYVSLVDFKIGEAFTRKISKKEGATKLERVYRLIDMTGEIWLQIWEKNDPESYRKGQRQPFGKIS